MQTNILPPEPDTEFGKKEKKPSEPRIIFPAFDFEDFEEFKPLPVSLN